MKKKASSTLISLKVEDELLAKLDAYCERTGMSRTAAIQRSVMETLQQFSVNESPDTISYMKAAGQWYEWTDYEGNWCLPGSAGSFGERDRILKEQTRSLQQLYAYYAKNWIETGDFQKLVTCRGVNGLAVIWTYSRVYIGSDGRVINEIQPYLQKTVATMKRRCREGIVLTDSGDDGTSDFRIIWFVPEGCIKNLQFENVLDASNIFESLINAGA